ncbi:MAG: elongation factor EF-2 [Candidatus Helarchaeota archaeon]|nr:elongation factor EF-2 [Candidatus Helarchaeota archaeon]
MTYTKKVSDILPLMRNTENIRNVGILAHIDHGKTTLSDNLLARCGLLSPSLAGQARALDYLEEEQKRGITMKTANISLPFEFKDQLFIINLIDTPGHVDFSGARDQSLRVVDGAIIVVDAVEGCMVQTEIVTKQALEEFIKPLLFINKIDRLILELKLSLKEIEIRLNEIIQDFNNLIELYALDSYKKQWQIDVKKGNIGFGSALHLWGCTAEEMLQKSMKFGDILKFYRTTHSKDTYTQIQKHFPLSDSIFKMIINQLPNPRQAQRYRIPRLWSGDTSSKIGQDLLKCDPNGAALLYIYKNIADKNLGIISLGRIFSGTLRIGQEFFSLSSSEYNRIQQLFLFMGAHRETIKTLPAGNIIAFNIGHPKIGDTLVERNYEDAIPFEKIKYESEAVVQYSIEPLHPRELKRMIMLLENLAINDPNLKITVNEETGEILISGLGELHLEVISNELKKQGMEVITSEPIVTYRESVREKSELITVESADSQNSIIFQVEPLEQQIVTLLTTGQLNIQMSKNRRIRILQKVIDWDEKLIKNLIYTDNFGNAILLDPNKYNFEFKDDALLLLYHKLEKIFRFGPLIHDPIRGIKVKIQNISLKSEISQFNILNIIPLLKQGISEVLLSSNSILLQPIYKIQIKTLQSYIGAVSSIIAQRNGRTSQVEQKGSNVFISGQIPVRGTFGLANVLRSKASGHVFWQTFLSHWEPIMPESLMREIIQEMRIKRGLTK